jgi:hypothetical protein
MPLCGATSQPLVSSLNTAPWHCHWHPPLPAIHHHWFTTATGTHHCTTTGNSLNAIHHLYNHPQPLQVLLSQPQPLHQHSGSLNLYFHDSRPLTFVAIATALKIPRQHSAEIMPICMYNRNSTSTYDQRVRPIEVYGAC